jgi:hypothetical protein
MKTLLASAMLLIALAGRLPADESKLKNVQAGKQETTACHGTTVTFVETPVEAAKLASQQKKLVFVLHVSGHFEDPNFT